MGAVGQLTLWRVDADTLIWYFDQKMIVIHSNCVVITLFPTNRQNYSMYIFGLALNMLPFSHAAIIFVLRSMRLQEMDIVTMGV